MFRLLVLVFVVMGSTGDHDVAAHQPVPPMHVFSLDEMHDHEGHHFRKPHYVNMKDVYGMHYLDKNDVVKIPDKPQVKCPPFYFHLDLIQANAPDVRVHYLNQEYGKKGDKTDRIFTEFLNPDYVEPITVLDYRYLKTGGRDYTRGAGGQILILPKGVRIDEKKEFENFDEMLEYLQHKQLAENEGNKNIGNFGHNEYPKHYIKITGDYGSKFFTADGSDSQGNDNDEII